MASGDKLLVRYAVRVAGMIVQELRLRRAMRELASLHDHELREIGIRREEIERRVRDGACNGLAARSAPIMQRTFVLDRNALIRVRGRPGQSVCVRRGAAWLTQDRDSRDIVLQAGDRFVCDRDGFALIGTPIGAEVSVVGDHAPLESFPHHFPSDTHLPTR